MTLVQPLLATGIENLDFDVQGFAVGLMNHTRDIDIRYDLGVRNNTDGAPAAGLLHGFGQLI